MRRAGLLPVLRQRGCAMPEVQGPQIDRTCHGHTKQPLSSSALDRFGTAQSHGALTGSSTFNLETTPMTSISSDSTTAPSVPLTVRPIPPSGTVPDTGSRAKATQSTAEIIDLEWRITENLQSGGGIWLTNGQYPSTEHIISVICHELASVILTPEPGLIEVRPLEADPTSRWQRLGTDSSHETNLLINANNALQILDAAVCEGFVVPAEMRAKFLALLGGDSA